MKTLIFIIIMCLCASTAFSCVLDKDIKYEQIYDDGNTTTYMIVGSFSGSDPFTVSTKIVTKTRSKKSSCSKQDIVINCKKDTFKLLNCYSYRNNIEIGHHEKTNEKEIEDDTLPAKLVDMYCKGN